MDALTATKPVVLVLDIKTIPALYHLTYQPRQKSSTVSCLSQPTDQWISKKIVATVSLHCIVGAWHSSASTAAKVSDKTIDTVIAIRSICQPKM